MAESEDWAYLAGVIDGEGYLSIAAHIAPSRTYVLRPTLEIGNTDKRVVDFCYKVLDVKWKLDMCGKNRQTPYYRFRLHGRDLKYPLQKLLPYLISKKEVAKLILKWISLHQHNTAYTTGEIELANQVREMSRKNGHRARQIPLDKVPINIKKEVCYA